MDAQVWRVGEPFEVRRPFLVEEVGTLITQ